MRIAAALLAAWLQPAPAPPSPAAVVAEVATLAAATDNDARFAALTALIRSAGLSFAVEPFTLDRPMGGDPRTQGRNIVVSIGQGERTIVVGAHYDAAWLPDGSISRGAVDNAASSILLIHAAQALAAERLGARVLVVWFDMEESGLVGSERYVAAHADARPAQMLNFDINAYGDTVLYAPSAGDGASSLRGAIVRTCADLVTDCVRFAQLPNSDDRPFARAGVPTASFAMLPAAEAHHFWLALNAGRGPLAIAAPPPIGRTIHTASDTIDKVDGASVLRGATFAAAIIRRLAD